MNNFLRYDQAKTYSVWIKTLSVVYVTEKFEQLILIFFLNPLACILNSDFEIKSIVFLFDFGDNFYFAFLRKLNSIRLKIEYHLFDPIFIMHNFWVVKSFFVTYVFHQNFKFYALWICFHLLYWYNIVD